MEIKNQIRAYRSELGMSQEELAEAIYVTRQTVSNWETGKSYPDIQSLLRLSSLFGISLDQLIKGDWALMKEKINAEDVSTFNRLSKTLTLMMVISLLAWAPLAYFLGSSESRETSAMHPQTKEELIYVLTMLRDKGEKETFRYLRSVRDQSMPILQRNTEENT